MSLQNNETRRRFLKKTVQSAAAVAATQVLGEPAPPSASADDETVKSYRRVSEFKTGANRARSIAAGPNGDIFVAADQKILVFDDDGKSVRNIELQRPARGVHVEPTGQVWMTTIRGVASYSPEGKLTTQWNSPDNSSVFADLVVTDERVFVADAGMRLVWSFTREGKVQAKIRRTVTGFAAPAEFFSLAADNEGHLQVINPGRHRVEVYSAEGEFVSQWGSRSRQIEGFSGCCNPVSLSTLQDGRFATAERGQPRVKIYSANGQFETLVAGPEFFTRNASASANDDQIGCHVGGLEVAVDANQRILILDRVTANIHIMA